MKSTWILTPFFSLALLAALGLAAAALLPFSTAAIPGAVPETPAAGAAIPAAMVLLYQEAAARCPGLSWTVLAAIGTVESGNGQSRLPGVRSGANRAGAEGPMQFEPATFAAYARPVPPGGANPPSPYDPVDAVYAAARMLCADGGATTAGLARAVFDYNHSGAYVDQVLALAQQIADAGGGSAQLAASAAAYALAQVGTPYRWGGEAPGVGFDCSGLAQAAYRSVGVALGRVAQDQFDAGPLVPATTPLAPGDLVFFGSGPADVTHVGLFVGTSAGQAYMVDAPHPGASVRVEAFDPAVGGSWGGDLFVGATRPG